MFSHSVLNPMSPQGQAISNLFIFLMIAAGALFAGLPLTLAYTLPKYRHRPGQGDPPQTYGVLKMELVWTTIPILLLIGVFGATISTMRIAQPNAIKTADLTVIGHQWWWEYRYPNGVVTANILHIPTGRRLNVALESVDVIHSFWVPELNGKMDAVPGQTNSLWLEADKPGIYEGACVEFCGTGHAWMRLSVVAQPPAQFDAWLRQQARPARQPSTAMQKAGARLFAQYACASCHLLRGRPSNTHLGSKAVVIAPDLTHFASRPFFGGGVLDNTPANLVTWLHDPNLVKQGVHMPNFQLTPSQIHELTAYLESLT